MARPKGSPKIAGRKKGTPNKVPLAVKDMVMTALKNLGGVEYLEGLAKDEPRAFAVLVGRLLPSEVKAELRGGGVELILRNYSGRPHEGQPK